jgi:hypothetical protein
MGISASCRITGGLELMRKKSVTKENITPGIACTAPWRLTKVKPLENYVLEVEFNDSAHGVVEMIQLIMSDRAGVFSVLKDQDLFNKAHLAMHDAIKQKGRWVLQ